MHASWPAGLGPAGSLWHVLHSSRATVAATWGLWQSPQPADPACAACSGARSVWQLSQAFAVTDGSPWGLWQVTQSVVACVALIAAKRPSGCAWQVMHVGIFWSGAKAW